MCECARAHTRRRKGGRLDDDLLARWQFILIVQRAGDTQQRASTTTCITTTMRPIILRANPLATHTHSKNECMEHTHTCYFSVFSSDGKSQVQTGGAQALHSFAYVMSRALASVSARGAKYKPLLLTKTFIAMYICSLTFVFPCAHL